MDLPTWERLPTDFMQVRDLRGKLVSAPWELVVRREGFAQKFGGLRYTVRGGPHGYMHVPSSVRQMQNEYPDEVRTWLLDRMTRSAAKGPRERWDRFLGWDFDLQCGVWQDRRGWFFHWGGEDVAAPFNRVQHTDGRCGAYLPLENRPPLFESEYPTVLHMIESQSLSDLVADWDEWHGATGPIARAFDELPVVPEASGPWAGWRMDADVAVYEFQYFLGEPKPQRPWGFGSTRLAGKVGGGWSRLPARRQPRQALEKLLSFQT
ncbi:hypothetical protein [Streptomyces sp. Ncost-T10-10d]|uniref:hypothetical protein n=1 Tax=Streptomyces sp. Ncost-T10-10d TaxID=1839774 RepID=UPI00081E949F|nr:hypothetical protein [Streptomyces sp. Ncost-T10-10d]SCF98590.1 hypothetical protein GA0115254_13152 [Streptomyces sp. Ncost-T10-10d]